MLLCYFCNVGLLIIYFMLSTISISICEQVLVYLLHGVLLERKWENIVKFWERSRDLTGGTFFNSLLSLPSHMGQLLFFKGQTDLVGKHFKNSLASYNVLRGKE